MAKCLLEGCNREARRKFCCNKHKDRYHNIRNPRGKFAHLGSDGGRQDYDDDDGYGHIFDSGDAGHGQF